MGKKVNRRPLVLRTLEESLSDIHQLNESGYTIGKKWDLAHICQHLNKTMRMTFEGADFGWPFFVQPFARVVFMWVVRNGKQINAPAAPPSLAPENEIDLEKEIQEYESLVQRLNDDQSEFKYKHPIAGKLCPQDWRALHAWHAAHHLSFLHPKEAVPAE